MPFDNQHPRLRYNRSIRRSRKFSTRVIHNSSTSQTAITRKPHESTEMCMHGGIPPNY
ncbi:42354_t:CDS:2 [Gigaspora margarita]|uniref:42354_t:CDS:1 n=1 Tax=Gigaspora margarita TaxID=4874 RepID=A0ABN7ULN4_GIGMA|nr:42354_t:CDS:2 [Gigaspora margarita]